MEAKWRPNGSARSRSAAGGRQGTGGHEAIGRSCALLSRAKKKKVAGEVDRRGWTGDGPERASDEDDERIDERMCDAASEVTSRVILVLVFVLVFASLEASSRWTYYHIHTRDHQ
jgi:hypothetical protein